MSRNELTAISLAAALVGVLSGSGAAQAAGPTKVSPEQALLASVKQHPLAKLGPWLINLDDEYQQYARSPSGANGRSGFKSSNPALDVRNGAVAIEGVANDPAAFRGTLAAVGATNLHGSVRASRPR